MAEPEWPENVELSDFLTDLENVQLKVRVPPPIIVLLKTLIKNVKASHRRQGAPSPGELVAALLVKGLREGNALGDVVGDYRETKVHEVLQDARVEEGAYPLPARSELDL